jgi:hypothetical protein
MKNNKNKYIYNYWLLIIFFITFIFISIAFYYIFLKKNKILEPFEWSQDTIYQFNRLQSTINPLSHFNIPILQQQASEEEVKYLLKNGNWPWSKIVENLYLDEISKNKILHLTPSFSMEKAKKLYNENTIKQMLYWKTKEGQFILSGGINNNNEVIKCFSYLKGPSIMKKIQQNGYNLWNGYRNEKITTISNDNIPLEMPGFSFVKGSCNPCIALDNDYTCPFNINIKGNNTISEIWKNLWNL